MQRLILRVGEDHNGRQSCPSREFNTAACPGQGSNPRPLVKLEEISYHLIQVCVDMEVHLLLLFPNICLNNTTTNVFGNSVVDT